VPAQHNQAVDNTRYREYQATARSRIARSWSWRCDVLP